ncbi:MAG: HNH endonuclease [Candidatus Cloacimonetes bacterium]|nr:HNH endonuclease [Candidatus Cloacimonadota bacterium]
MKRKAYLEQLLKKSHAYVWHFTKQDSSFEHVYKATLIFDEWKRKHAHESLEVFFGKISSEHGVRNNYRMLIIAQHYGLLTKEHDSYKDEKVTNVFVRLKESWNTQERYAIISEQSIKMRLPSITDGIKGPHRKPGNNVYPVVFMYQVLRELLNRNIHSISKNELYLFVMTFYSHSEVNKAVELILDRKYPLSDKAIKELLGDYKDASRIISMIAKSVYLFNLGDEVSINQDYMRVMDKFLAKNFGILTQALKSEESYKDFLTNIQGFNVSLCPEALFLEDIIDDDKYGAEVNALGIIGTDEDLTKYNDNYKLAPVKSSTNKSGYATNAAIGKRALARAEYKCELDSSHFTFVSRFSKRNFTEAHHLIPMSKQDKVLAEWNVNLDCYQNIVSLCPNCHRSVHYGKENDIKKVLKKLYDIRKDELKGVNLDLTFEDFYKLITTK